jgi:FKBP-type peptidyl-prolyl cis-trans isomerase SlyD
MTIEKNTVVSFHYRLSEGGNELENSYDGQPLLVLIGQGGLIPGLEKALIGKSQGDKFEVAVAPEDAYGQRAERELMRVPIKHLLGKPKKIKKGQVVYMNTKEGERTAVAVKVGKFNVDVDTNHPFAGKTLDFAIEILETREASENEIQHGHAHGAGGHQH